MSTLLLYAVVFACICVAVFGAYRLYVWIMDADHDRDPFAREGLTVNAAQAMDIDMTMPPEIAHEAPTRGVAQGRAVRVRAFESRPAARADMTGSLTPRHHQEDPGPLARGGPGQTSPATLPPAPPVAGLPPGTAAAAGLMPAPATPPPLPDPAYAAANPGCWPLAWLESDTFVGGLKAIQDGAR